MLINVNKKKYNPFIFSSEGVAKSADVLYTSLMQHYTALRRDMFVWEDDSGKCDDMFIMSRNRCPEEHLVNFGMVSFFELNGSVHALSVSEQYRKLNVYGYLDEWRVNSPNPEVNNMLYNTVLNNENAVLCEDSLTFTNDCAFIENIVMGMVDILLTMRQRSILNRQPFIFTYPQGENPKQGEVGTFMNALLNCSPYIIRASDSLDFKVFPTDVNVDIGITDYFSFLESLILSHIGYDATDIHKRAQQSVPETLLAQDRILARRHEKLRLREYAAERCNKLFGCNLKVTCVLDGYDEEQQQPESALDALDLRDSVEEKDEGGDSNE